eukprot:gene11723-11867_t
MVLYLQAACLNGNHTGFSVELWTHIAAVQGWSPGSDWTFSCLTDARSLLQDLADPHGQCTLGATGVALSMENINAGDFRFSWPILKSGYSILTTDPHESTDSFLFTDVYHWSVWLLMFMTPIVVAFLVTIAEILTYGSKANRKGFRGARGIAALDNLGVTCGDDSSFSNGPASKVTGHSHSANSEDISGSSLTIVSSHGGVTSDVVTDVKSPDGAAVVRPYDLLIGADQCGGASLIASAMNELEQRKAAHSKHPAQHTTTMSGTAPRAAATGNPAPPAAAPGGGATSTQSSEGSAGPAVDHAAAVLKHHYVTPLELEFKCWHDLPQQPELTALLPEAGRADAGPKPGDQGTADIQQGWLLLWSGGGAGSSSRVWGVPGGPCCSLMAWPNRSRGSWSGAVFAAPQVFESLRSQAEYERLLQGLTADKQSSSHMTGGVIPGLWMKAIAAQLKNQGARSLGRVEAPSTPVPSHVTSPAAGLLLLSPAAGPTLGPQLFSPGLSLGLEDGAQLTALVTTAVASAADAGDTSSGIGIGQHVESKLEACLAAFDKQRRPQAAALQHLEAQLSWLRHPFSPAAAAAARTLSPGTLAWLFGLFGMTRLGLALQWRCLVQVLPLVAGVMRALGASAADLKQQPTPTSRTSESSNKADNSIVVLANLAKTIRPAGGSFVAFLHTAALPMTDIKQLLAVAPLLLAVLWGGVVFIAIKLVQWCMLAIRVWSYAHG